MLSTQTRSRIRTLSTGTASLTGQFADKPRSAQNRARKPWQNRRGAAIVEAALVLPIFFMVIMGIIEFGRAFNVAQLVQNSAREACRKAVTGAFTNATIISEAKSALTSVGVPSNHVTVTIVVTPYTGNPTVANNETSNATTRDLVEVTVSVPFNKVSYLSGKYLQSKTLTGKSSMRHE